MVSGVIVAVLKEQFADHIVLSDETSLRLADGWSSMSLVPGLASCSRTAVTAVAAGTR